MSSSGISRLHYKSTPFFDVDETSWTAMLSDDSNYDNHLWQLLLQKLRQEIRNSTDNSNNIDTTSASINGNMFHQVIKSLHQECQFNVQTLEEEIETLKQALLVRDEEGCNKAPASFQTMTTRDDDFVGNNINIAVDEIISNKVLKAVFVGYQWTDDDRKRLGSAHPQDYHL
jgi:hypothetical protein